MTTQEARISIRLTTKEHMALKLYSVKNNVTIQDLARDAILRVIKRDTKWKI